MESCIHSLYLLNSSDYLKRSVKSKYAKFSDTKKFKKGQTKEEFIEEKREELKNDFEAKKKVPQGIVQCAIEAIRKDLGKDEEFMSHQLDKKVAANEESPTSNIEIWKEVVRDEFASAWSEAKESTDGANDSEDSDDEDDDLKESEEIRTCTTSLSKIIRPDIVDHFDDIVSIAEKNQKVITDIMSEVSILSLKTVHIVSKTICDQDKFRYNHAHILPSFMSFHRLLVGSSMITRTAKKRCQLLIYKISSQKTLL